MPSAPPVLEWTTLAAEDLLAIIDYISDDNPDAAQALKNDIDSKLSHLPNNPRMGRAGRVPGTREIVIRPTYLIVYAENPEAIRILRILHSSQLWP